MADTEHILERMSELFNGPNPLLANVERLPLFNDEPSVSSYRAYLAGRFQTISQKRFSGGGSFNPSNGLKRALGEAIERSFIIEKPRHIKVIKKKISEVPTQLCFENYIDEPILKTFSQFPISWVGGRSLITEKKVAVPAQMVFLTSKRFSKEKIFLPSNSSGAAGGNTREGAQLSGLMELIERDAFMVNYLARMSPKILDIADAPDSIVLLKKRIERYNLKLYILDLFTDLPVYAVCALVVDKTGFGAPVSLGLRAGSDLNDVLYGAIEESVFARSSERISIMNAAQQTLRKKQNKKVTGVDDRLLFWSSVSMLPKLSFFISGERISYRNMRARSTRWKKKSTGTDLQRLVHYFKKNNKEIVAVSLATPQLERKGFFVEKMFTPELQWMFLDESMRVINKDRLHEITKTHTHYRSFEINPVPHPFL